jgi:protoporphyrinogen/coproporphyrinogen III oxidase
VSGSPAPSAAIVGGGLSGLAAAYRLQVAGWVVRVFEAEPRAGGRVETVTGAGYLADTAASAVGAGYPAYHALARELGLPIKPGPPHVGIYREGRIRLLRMDRPVRSGLTSDLLSVNGKLRMARMGLDVARARTRGYLDSTAIGKAAPIDTETARDYSRRAVGVEIDRYVSDPITRIMQIADSDKVTKAELLSAIAGILGGRLSSLEGGQARMIRTLVERVGVELSSPVGAIAETDSGVEVRYFDPGGSERTETFDAGVVACPLPAATAVCAALTERLGPLIDEHRYTQAISVTIGTTRPAQTPAYFVLMPSCEDREIAYFFVDNNKSADRAPAGHGLLGVGWEMDASAEWMDCSDERIVERTLETAWRVFPELRGTVDFTHVRRWRLALPHHPPGAFARIGAFNERLDPESRLQFAGDYLAAEGQNSAVALGTRAAANLERVRPRLAGAATQILSQIEDR